GRLAGYSRQTVVLAAIVSLHALLVYLLASTAREARVRSSASAVEAEIIPVERRLPPPPPLVPPTVQAITPIDILAPRIPFDSPPEQVTKSQPIATEPLHDGPPPVIASTPPADDPRPDVGPRPISGPVGSYPVASVKAKESGKVLTEICVSPVGTVDTVHVARSSGFSRLDQVAVRIASQYRSRPATRDGIPVHACVRYNIDFKLN